MSLTGSEIVIIRNPSSGIGGPERFFSVVRNTQCTSPNSRMRPFFWKIEQFSTKKSKKLIQFMKNRPKNAKNQPQTCPVRVSFTLNGVALLLASWVLSLEYTLGVSLLSLLPGDQLQICCILMQFWTKAGICGKVHFTSKSFQEHQADWIRVNPWNLWLKSVKNAHSQKQK